MLIRRLQEGRQVVMPGAIIVIGLILTFIITAEAIHRAREEVADVFERKAELYVDSIARHLENGHIAAKDLFNYFKNRGTLDLETFHQMLRYNTYLNRDRLYVGSTYSLTDSTRPKYEALLKVVYDDVYETHIPESQATAFPAHAYDSERVKFPLFYSWSGTEADEKSYMGLDIGANPALYDFLQTALKEDTSSAILMPPFPELDQGRGGLVLMAMPYTGRSGHKGVLLQILDFKALASRELDNNSIWYEGLSLNVVSAWHMGAYQTRFSTELTETLVADNGSFMLPAPVTTFVRRYGASDWQYRVTADPESVKPDYSTAAVVAIVCLTLTGLFFALFFFQGQRAKRVNEIVERRTRALKEAHNELEEHYRLLQNLNRDVEEARKSAEMANNAKSEFLATMSHELRTPLNAILGFSQLLTEEALGEIGDKRYVEYAKDIYSSGSHLLALINDILDLAKLEAGKVEIEHKPLDLEGLVERVRSLVLQQVGEKRLKVDVEVSKDLPPVIMGDELRLRQILINLSTNAVKFTHTGSVNLRLHPKQFRDGRAGWVMEVEDTGIGIPEEKQATLFDRFTQVDTALSRRHGGVGLGLAICRELVSRMEGSISVRSTPGVGTTVRVHLPLEVSDFSIEDDDMI